MSSSVFCLSSFSSRKRRNSHRRDLLLSKVSITPRTPVTAPVLLRHLLFSPTPALAPRCSPPCPRCPRKRRTPPRSWTAPPAPPVQWVHTLTLPLNAALSLLIRYKGAWCFSFSDTCFYSSVTNAQTLNTTLALNLVLVFWLSPHIPVVSFIMFTNCFPHSWMFFDPWRPHCSACIVNQPQSRSLRRCEEFSVQGAGDSVESVGCKSFETYFWFLLWIIQILKKKEREKEKPRQQIQFYQNMLNFSSCFLCRSNAVLEHHFSFSQVNYLQV